MVCNMCVSEICHFVHTMNHNTGFIIGITHFVVVAKIVLEPTKRN